MKKILTLLLAFSLVLCAVGCNKVDPDKKSEGVMTHAEFMAAELDSEVVIEGFVQAKQSWWDNKGTFYLQDGTGGYFVYEMPCSQSEYDSLVVGTKIKVTGSRAAWGGMDEIMNVTAWEIVGTDTYVAEAVDLTDKLGDNAELTKYTSALAAFNDMTVVSFEYGSGNAPDIYLTLSKGDAQYTFCVECYLTNANSEVYQAVEALVAGDVVDIEGFVYWYSGSLNTHITKVTK